MKPYYLAGSDNDKASILKTLAETDFITVHRRENNKNFQTAYPNQLIEGKIPQELINNHLENYFDYYLSVIEMELAIEFSFNFKKDIFGNPKAERIKIPKSPLFVSTVLMENECGEIRPYTTEDNKLWCQQGKRRFVLGRQSRNN
jgi:hypothetical protein